MDAANRIKRNNSLLNQKKVAGAGTWPVGRQSEVPCLTGATGHRSWRAPNYPRPQRQTCWLPFGTVRDLPRPICLVPGVRTFILFFPFFFPLLQAALPRAINKSDWFFLLFTADGVGYHVPWYSRSMWSASNQNMTIFFLNYRWQHLAEFLHPPKCF